MHYHLQLLDLRDAPLTAESRAAKTRGDGNLNWETSNIHRWSDRLPLLRIAAACVTVDVSFEVSHSTLESLGHPRL